MIILKRMFLDSLKNRFQKSRFPEESTVSKVWCVFSMVVVFMLPHAEIGRNDHREGAPRFNLLESQNENSKSNSSKRNRILSRNFDFGTFQYLNSIKISGVFEVSLLFQNIWQFWFWLDKGSTDRNRLVLDGPRKISNETGPDQDQQNFENLGPIRTGRSSDLVVRWSLGLIMSALSVLKPIIASSKDSFRVRPFCIFSLISIWRLNSAIKHVVFSEFWLQSSKSSCSLWLGCKPSISPWKV